MSSTAVAAGITQAQKQTLIDNLQLEITERARKLRAQYALQAAGLRARLEMRVNRIPVALRKRKMGELLDEYAARAEKPEKPAEGLVVIKKREGEVAGAGRGVKRSSEHLSTAADNNDDRGGDKENATPAKASTYHDHLPIPKKRAKTTTATATTTTANPTKPTRTTSRKPLQPISTVLSPKSHNSRTLPRSPFKSSSEKTLSVLERLASPVKPPSQHPTAPAPPPKTTAATVERATSRQLKKRGAAPPPTTATVAAAHTEDVDADVEGQQGRSSGASDASSAGTTIVTKSKVGRAVGGRKAAAKTAGTVAGAGAGRKADAGKKEATTITVPMGGGRTLRKRG